jgi:DNA-binding CsgD family transcriptional regulator
VELYPLRKRPPIAVLVVHDIDQMQTLVENPVAHHRRDRHTRGRCQSAGGSRELSVPTRTGDHAQPAAPVANGARPLTQRHLEILSNVARGHTNRQIGETLGISEKTVRNHLRTISHKLSTSDRTHAVVLAIGNGWIPIPIEPDNGAAASVPRHREEANT